MIYFVLNQRTQRYTRRFTCSTCGVQYGTLSTMKDHVRIHSAVRSFVCTDCGSAFRLKNSLKRHIRNRVC